METNYDLIVVGGSLSGCFSALSAARAGARVILIESRTYLGSEFTATLRPWLQSKEVEGLNNEIKEIFFDDEENIKYNVDNIKDEIPFYNGIFKKKLLALLMNAGVTVLFASIAAGIVVSDNRVVGVAIANKSGLQVILGKIVVDATENKIVARLADDNIRVLKGQYIARRTIEYFDVLPPESSIYKVDSDIGVLGNKVNFHPGKKGEAHWFVEFSFKINVDTGAYDERMGWELEARNKTILLCEYLKKYCTYFSNAKLARTSPEIFMPPIFSIEGIQFDDIFRFGVESKKYKNLFIINVQSYLSYDSDEFELNQIYKDSQAFGKFIEERTSTIEDLLLASNIYICFGQKSITIEELNPQYQVYNSLKVAYYSIDIPKWNVFPILDECNILVVGGGTSGASAAIAAARAGESVTLLESQYALGGTGTIGGINIYFFGNRVGFTAELDKKVEKMERRLSTFKPKGDNSDTKWNIEVKQMTYMTEILNNKGKIFFGTTAAGTIIDNNIIKGVIAATPDGIRVLKSSITIDATGDGDVAVSAGVDYFIGDPRGGNIQTFNQCEWRFEEVLSGINLDRGVIDIGDFIDTTRGIIMAHEYAREYDFSPYPSVRESRHILGDYCFKVADVLCRRKFKDTITVGWTRFDQHGFQSSWFARLGYLPYHYKEFKAYMPYRACLPKGIDNLLVVGKAFSATKDAFSFMRMQPELQNLGYAAGIAAVLSFRNSITPRQLDIELLQKKLIEIGILSMEDLQVPEQSEDMYFNLVNELAMGKEEKLIEVLCSPKDKVISLLEESYSCCVIEEGRLLLAMALTWFGSKIAISELLEKLVILHKEKQSSTFDSARRPQGGYLTEPDIYWKVNQIIILLGLSGNYGVLDTLRIVAEDTDSGGPPNPHERLHWRRVPNYDRIASLCFSFERLADRGSIEVLEKLLDKPYLNGYVCKDVYSGDGNYASALLELIIARTLARCGGVKGGLVLANYIDDVRKVLSDHAYRELKSITDQDFGKNSGLWIEWLNNNTLPVKPFTDTSDIIKG